MVEHEVDAGIVAHTESIRVGHRSVSAVRFAPVDSTGSRHPAVLFVHGLNSDQSGYADRARATVAHLRAVSLTLDLSGHGDTGGNRDLLTPLDNLADLLAAFDLLAVDPAVDETRIGVCGASYGAYLAAYMTADRPVARLLLRAPGLYADRELGEPLTVPRISDPQADAPDLERRLRGYSGDVLVLEGEFDEVISSDVIAVYLRAFRHVRHSIVPGAPHALRDSGSREYFQDEIIRFFAEL